MATPRTVQLKIEPVSGTLNQLIVWLNGTPRLGANLLEYERRALAQPAEVDRGAALASARIAPANRSVSAK